MKSDCQSTDGTLEARTGCCYQTAIARIQKRYFLTGFTPIGTLSSSPRTQAFSLPGCLRNECGLESLKTGTTLGRVVSYRRSLCCMLLHRHGRKALELIQSVSSFCNKYALSFWFLLAEELNNLWTGLWRIQKQKDKMMKEDCYGLIHLNSWTCYINSSSVLPPVQPAPTQVRPPVLSIPLCGASCWEQNSSSLHPYENRTSPVFDIGSFAYCCQQPDAWWIQNLVHRVLCFCKHG